MTPQLSLPALFAIAPKVHITYADAFQRTSMVLPRFGLTTAGRIAHFLAQVLHETAGLTRIVENLNYTTPELLMKTWKTRFPTRESALPYVSNPRALANKVYGGRMGNMNAEDGWHFRGRGLLQITGRVNYQAVTDVLGVDFTVAPDKALLPAHALDVAACLWHLLGANVAADTDDLEVVTRCINGGQHGIESRATWLEKSRTVVR